MGSTSIDHESWCLLDVLGPAAASPCVSLGMSDASSCRAAQPGTEQEVALNITSASGGRKENRKPKLLQVCGERNPEKVQSSQCGICFSSRRSCWDTVG